MPEEQKDAVEALREEFSRVVDRLTPDVEPATVYIPDDHS
jgi:hypothetical protein